jgi:hypothetical protein
MKRDEIEREMSARSLTAPHVTAAGIDDKITREMYYVFPGTTTTVCCLLLANGFTVTGQSACVSPENFDEDLGRKVAYSRARDKIWALEGYLLREKLADDSA